MHGRCTAFSRAVEGYAAVSTINEEVNMEHYDVVMVEGSPRPHLYEGVELESQTS